MKTITIDGVEYNLLPKVKFKAGNWIVCWNRTYQILDNKSTYIVREINGLETRYEHSTVDENGRLWTIADAKDGDVLALNGKPFIYSHNKYGKNYCYIDEWGQLRVNFSLVFEGNYVCPATKQEHDLLFSKMREVGYEWDADKKEFRKIKPHYDIINFKPFDKVLVRDRNTYKWKADYFSHYAAECMFSCVGSLYKQCIPYEGNEHLLGTTDMCDEQYINW